MNDKPLISIIIPVYNTEKYVSRAIESALAQTYSNIEIILIDDGSTDNSAIICKKYAEKDRRVIYLFIEHNGVSAARNRGMEVSQGDFMEFLDSDDEMGTQKTEFLLQAMENYDADIVFSGFHMCGIRNEKFSPDNKVWGKKEFCVAAYIDRTLNYIVGVVYDCMIRTQIVKLERLRFREEVVRGEDGLFIIDVLEKCKKIVTMNLVLYELYRFDEKDRLSATGYITADMYQFEIEYLKRWQSNITLDEWEEHKESIARRFFDRFIPELIRMVFACSVENDNAIKRLNDVIENSFIQSIIQSYKKDDRKKSSLIPWCIKRKKRYFLYYVLFVKAMKLKRKYETYRINYWKKG